MGGRLAGLHEGLGGSGGLGSLRGLPRQAGAGERGPPISSSPTLGETLVNPVKSQLRQSGNAAESTQNVWPCGTPNSGLWKQHLASEGFISTEPLSGRRLRRRAANLRRRGCAGSRRGRGSLLTLRSGAPLPLRHSSCSAGAGSRHVLRGRHLRSCLGGTPGAGLQEEQARLQKPLETMDTKSRLLRHEGGRNSLHCEGRGDLVYPVQTLGAPSTVTGLETLGASSVALGAPSAPEAWPGYPESATSMHASDKGMPAMS